MDLVAVEAWRRWAVSRRGQGRRLSWERRFPSLQGWAVDELGSPASSGRTDRMQRDLVALAQEGESEAALTLLVQLRPGLVRLVRWLTARGSGGYDESVDEVRAAFYETLCRHPLDRRPARIAANLLLDTRQRLHRSQLRAARTSAADDAELDRLRSRHPALAPDPVDGLVVLWAIRRAIDDLPGSPQSRLLTARAAYRAWILGQPRAVVAEELGLGPAAVSTRLHRLRRSVVLSAAA